MVFAVHNHQPIGNFDAVFEESHRLSYRPFLDVLSRHPSIKITQHWTGPLLEWIEAKHPETIELMRTMIQRGQLELLTGAYYEAILAVIPEHDRIGQIRKLTRYLHQLFGVTPTGMWLAERVWEQQLAGTLAKAGVEFVMIDDTHFKHAGLRDDQLLGSYVSEELGSCVQLFPIDKTLRYGVPFRPIAETRDYLERIASEQADRVVLNADDGEKFGVWPKTFKHVYEDGWLEGFCHMLEENEGWIKTSHPSAIAAQFPPQGRIYLPTASYHEMMKWSLPSESFLDLERFEHHLQTNNLLESYGMFVRGGYWRNFLAKYPEANHMHKKMLRLSERIQRFSERHKVPDAVRDRLWAGQCNDAYWHGVFGGLYLPNLRFPIYRNLIFAESDLDKLEPLPPIRIDHTDFDCDGSREVLVESDVLNLYFKPSAGGSLVECDYKPIGCNLLDVLSRREEGYHRRLLYPEEYRHAGSVHDGILAKEAGLENHLHFDWYRHASLLDHFFGETTTLEGFARCQYQEQGDFLNQPYEAQWTVDEKQMSLHLAREGALWFDGRPHRLRVEKSVHYTAGTSEVVIDYTLTNGEGIAVELWFGVELCIGLLAGDAHDRYYLIDNKKPNDCTLRSAGHATDVKAVGLVDEWLGIRVDLGVSKSAHVWRFPIETVSLSEGGFERLYQCSVVTPSWRFRLEEHFAVRITQSIVRLNNAEKSHLKGRTVKR